MISELLADCYPVGQASVVAATIEGADGHELIYRQSPSTLRDHLAQGVRLKTLQGLDWGQA